MKFGIIGFGSLGKAFAAGLVKSGTALEDLCITARSDKTRGTAKETYPDANVTADKLSLVSFSDIIVLAVEPQNADEVLKEINGADLGGKIIVSFMSGVKISDIVDKLSDCTGEYHAVKVIPNVAISTCHGVSAIVRDSAPDEVLDTLRAIFGKLGVVITVDEAELPAVTVVAACGTAFASVLIKAYQDTSADYLSDSEAAKQITTEVFVGALSLIRESRITVDELPSLVATKGGATQAGLDRIDESVLHGEMAKAFEASYNRIVGG